MKNLGYTSKLIFSIILFGISLPVSGQLRYDMLTTTHGLSQGYVYDILQDKDGFIWFGTKDGLNRYDGYSFKVYTYDSYNPYSISNNNVNRLFEDSKGRLWVSTDDGINIFDKSRNRFRRILHNPKIENSISGNKIYLPIIELPDGRFLVFPEEKNLDVITLPSDFFESDGEPVITHLSASGAYNVTCMYMDGNKKVWIISDKVFELMPADMSLIWRKDSFLFGRTAPAREGAVWTDDVFFSEVQDTNVYPLFSKDIAKGHGRTFMHDMDKKRFWLGITDSARLEIYDIKNWKRGSPVDPVLTRMYGFGDVTPSKIYKDRSGLIWLGTNGYGVRKYTNDLEKFNHIASGKSIRQIMSLPNNQIYVRGWGELTKFDVHGKNLTEKVDKSFFADREFFIGKGFNTWGLRRKKGFKADNYDESIDKFNLVTKTSTTYKINVNREEALHEPKLEDSKGHIWLTGYGGRLIILNPHTGAYKKITINTDAINPMLKGSQINAVYEDGAGIYWAGTESGLAKINFQFNASDPPKIEWYKTNSENKTALNYSHVTCMIDDAFDKNFLWVATKGGGLNKLNKTTNQFDHIDTKDGLPNNVVYGLLTDDAGNIWGSTNNGIFCLLFNKNGKSGQWQFRHFTKTSGLQDDEFNTGAFTKLSNGDLAFGGVNGINIFNPASVLQTGYTPNVFITNILLGNDAVLPYDKTGILNQTIEYTSSIRLNHLQDILTLEFSSLDFTEPSQNKYRYRLVGIDKDWVESGSRRTATYVHLPAGSYTFKVQGSNSEGVWSDKIAELKIKVLPPWWRSWLAYIAYAILIAFAIRSFFSFSVNRAKLKSQLHFEQNEAKRVKELDTVKTQLYANITHEFRTPLTVILGMAQQLKNDPEKYLDVGVEMVIRNGENLLNLVNEMLDLSKLEAGKMSLNLVNADIISFLRYIVESFQSLAANQQKQFHFLADIDELLVTFDGEKFRQIITNLFSNALKFTPAKGNIYVSVSSEIHEDPNKCTLIMKVKDTGIGIPENELLHIFDRFYQIDDSHTRKTGGTGIGLSLTRELVKLMDGNISVKSPPVGSSKGTEFIITIPLTLVETFDDKITSAAETKSQPVTFNTETTLMPGPSEAKNGQALILLVEDNADVVAYTASCLPDYRLCVGKDGSEGFDIAVSMVPDLIITDVMMPLVDGFEMVLKLRQDERSSHIPIIMLTAKADIQSKLEGIDKGADVYLEKPFNKEELLLRIKKLLELRKSLQQYYSRQIGIESNIELTEETVNVEIEKKEHVFVKKIREIVEANFNNFDFSVEQLSKLMFMSHSQLHRKLEALVGTSPNKFIRIVRLNKAKTLLTTSNDSITVVAFECGYNDAGYFARVFRQDTGLTPQEWRNKYSE